MRGGLDDALDKLARRDELRRRASGEATPLAVQELVEAIASVVGRNPKLEVTVGVEGVGDPTLLHFFVEDGMVRVNADSSVAARPADPAGPRHADFDLEPEEPPVEEPFQARPAAHAMPSFDDRDRYDPGTGYDHPPVYGDDADTDALDPARFRSPFAATPPPPVPPQHQQAPHQPIPEPRAAAEQEPERGMPAPLPEPIPLETVDSKETEQAAKRLAAMLRDNPTLLRQDRP